jgi:hypothetical protein
MYDRRVPRSPSAQHPFCLLAAEISLRGWKNCAYGLRAKVPPTRIRIESADARTPRTPPPSDWQHVDRFPLTVSTAPKKPTPVVIGVNWYVEFDKPEQDAQGHYWIAATRS